MKKRRLLLTAGAVVWGGLCVYLIWSLLVEVQHRTTAQMNALQMTLAEEASRGIEDQISNLVEDLMMLARSPDVEAMNAMGRGAIDASSSIHRLYVQAVTRVDAEGRILYSTPDPQVIGLDISQQPHIRSMLRMQAPTISDLFISAQGHPSIAIHVPVFRNKRFSGSIGFLISFEHMAKRYLDGVHIGKSGYAVLITQNGTEIYCSQAGHLGKSLFETSADDQGIIDMGARMVSGARGAATLSSDHASRKALTAYAAYMPIHVLSTYWSVAVIAPENETLSLMRGFLWRWILTAVLLVAGFACAVLYLIWISSISRERSLRAAMDERYRSLIEQLPAINYSVDLGSTPRTTYISPQVESILGFTQQEWLADPELWIRQVHPDDRERVASQVRVEGTGTASSIEYRTITRGGEIRWIHNRRTLVRDAGGRAIFVNGVMLDVTDRHAAEQALSDSEELYRTLVATAPFAIFLTDLAGRVLFCNRQGQKMFGAASEQELVGTDCFSYIVPEDRSLARSKACEVLARGSVSGLALTFLRRDGRRFPGEFASAIIADAGGKPRSVIMFVQDISARKETEERLLQAQKMEAVGRLAGGVAHDFNNILTVIAGYAEVMLTSDEAGSLHEDLEEIRKAAMRASSLTGQLLAFSRRQVMKSVVLDINVQIRGMEKMLQRLIGEDVQTLTSLAPDLGLVNADPGQIEQVLMNLAVNSRDAMPNGGDFIITTANIDVGKGAPPWPQVAEGAYVQLSVRDTGEGMDTQTLSRVFEPFFTTKIKGKGTGLGLATVYGIITQSGGYILADSSPGQGAVFTIYLPRVKAEASTEAREEHPLKVLGGTGTLLLVEDEDMVRNLARSILAKAGYSIVEARDGVEALKVCGELSGKIDLVITDVVMPRMGGWELGRKLAAQYPDIRVIYISGYAEDLMGSGSGLDKEIDLIRKPFSAAEILTRINKALGRSP